jgi:putative transposase
LFGWASVERPKLLLWSSDSGPCYTVGETCEFTPVLGLVVCTTPTYSPESNGLAEAFIKTFKRE